MPNPDAPVPPPIGTTWGLLEPLPPEADDAVLAAMLEVERALVELAGGAEPGWTTDAVDRDVLQAGARRDGVAVPALVRALRSDADAAVAPLVHRGVTSQDVVDTALVLVARDALSEARRSLIDAGRSLAGLARSEQDTVTVARTLAQAAAPSTIGIAVASWLDGVSAAIGVLDTVDYPVQLGGPVGTADTFGGVPRAAVAERLGLADPGRSWQTERTPVLAVGQAAATTIAVCARVGRDLTQWSRPPAFVRLAAAGGSSAMAHKRNPVDAVLLVSAGLRAPGMLATLHAAAVSMDARPAGEWHAEWPALRDLVGLAAGAAAALDTAFDGLTVEHDAVARDAAALQAEIGDASAGGASTGVGATAAETVLAASARIVAAATTRFEERIRT